MTSVPFTLHVYGGLAECDGLIRPEADALVLEFQIRDNFLGVIRGKPKVVRIQLADLDSVELQGRWFGRKLAIKARSLMSLADVPAAERLVAGIYE